MAQPNDLEARVTALETQVSELAKEVRVGRQDAAAARLLAGAADRDVSEFRGEIRDFRQATTASFNALREDHLDLRRDLNGLRHETETGFTEMRGKLDATAAGIQRITELLTQQDGK